MKIYHLDIKDETDPRFDVSVFYTHTDESKTVTDLEEDYVRAYEYVTGCDDYEWTLTDILEKIDSYGWTPINVQTAKVRY